MAVAVTGYQRKQDSRAREESTSPIDMLLKGLSIAGQVTGIYSNFQQAQAFKQKADAEKLAAQKASEAETRGLSGKMTEPEFQKTLEGQKFTEIRAKEGEELPTSTLRRTVIGPTGEERSVLLRQVRPMEMETKASEAQTKAEDAKMKAEIAAAAKQSALQQKAMAAGEKQDLKAQERAFKGVSDLANKYESNPTTKDTQNIAASWERVQGAFKEPSAAGDLNLIFGYMKMLDPGSTVREGEFANAQNSASVPETIRAKYNQIQSGQRLTAAQRNDFFKQAQGVVKGQFEAQKRIDDSYKAVIKRNNWDEQQMRFVGAPDFGEQKRPSAQQQKMRFPSETQWRDAQGRDISPKKLRVNSANELPDL